MQKDFKSHLKLYTQRASRRNP